MKKKIFALLTIVILINFLPLIDSKPIQGSKGTIIDIGIFRLTAFDNFIDLFIPIQQTALIRDSEGQSTSVLQPNENAEINIAFTIPNDKIGSYARIELVRGNSLLEYWVITDEDLLCSGCQFDLEIDFEAPSEEGSYFFLIFVNDFQSERIHEETKDFSVQADVTECANDFCEEYDFNYNINHGFIETRRCHEFGNPPQCEEDIFNGGDRTICNQGYHISGEDNDVKVALGIRTCTIDNECIPSWSEWSEWSECDKNNRRSKSKSDGCGNIEIQGEDCEGNNCIQEWSEWSEFGECNEDGRKERIQSDGCGALNVEFIDCDSDEDDTNRDNCIPYYSIKDNVCYSLPICEFGEFTSLDECGDFLLENKDIEIQCVIDSDCDFGFLCKDNECKELSNSQIIIIVIFSALLIAGIIIFIISRKRKKT